MTNTTTKTTTDTTTTTMPTATDLAVVEKTALDRLKKSAAKDDLDDFLRGARRSLVLVDTSSSMDTQNYSGKRERRIDALRTIIRDLKKERTFPMAAFGRFVDDNGQFTTVRLVEDVPEPSGMTPLADAIRFGTREGATHLIVVTDGEPDSETAAYDAARAFSNPIDVFFVGEPGSAGESFAQRLAKMTGGTSGTSDLGTQQKQLGAKIAGLLGDGN